jgi:hypothetical protein
VLPDVNADDRDVGCGVSLTVLSECQRKAQRTEQRVLVGGGDDLELLGALVETEPAPSGSLDSGGLGVDLFLQVVKGAKVSGDLVVKSSRGRHLGLGRAARSEVLPEELGC